MLNPHLKATRYPQMFCWRLFQLVTLNLYTVAKKNKIGVCLLASKNPHGLHSIYIVCLSKTQWSASLAVKHTHTEDHILEENGAAIWDETKVICSSLHLRLTWHHLLHFSPGLLSVWSPKHVYTHHVQSVCWLWSAIFLPCCEKHTVDLQSQQGRSALDALAIRLWLLCWTLYCNLHMETFCILECKQDSCEEPRVCLMSENP